MIEGFESHMATSIVNRGVIGHKMTLPLSD